VSVAKGNREKSRVRQGTPTVTVIMPTRNERTRLPAVMDGLVAQTHPPLEVIVADGKTTDGTREWLAEFIESHPWVRIIDNPQRTIPTGLNLALSTSRGELIARMDAHADYAPDYLEQLAGFLTDHREAVGVGGSMQTSGVGSWGASIASTLSRSYGLGGAKHRVRGGGGPIDHVFCGCYRRAALIEVGAYDERLLANEDFEMDYRLRSAGYEIHLLPSAHTVWYVRPSPTALAKQMFRYGYYKALTLHLHPRSLKPRQMAPGILVVGLTSLLLVRRRPGLICLLAYLAGSAFLGGRGARRDGASALRGAVVPAVVHTAWGTGLVVGLVHHVGKRQK